jgi:HAD superfamily hydrolase (TIGR01549 family)
MSERVGRGVRAVLFDMDDTLYDHSYALESAVEELQKNDPRLSAVPLRTLVQKDQEVLRDVHLGLVLPGKVSLSESRVLRMVRLYESQGIELIEAEAQHLSELRRAAYLAHERAVPGARRLIEELRSNEVQVGVVSNNLLAEQRAKLSRIGLAGLVDSLTVSEEIGATKPDPRIFHLALTRCACPSAKVVFVGDSWREDVEGAHAARISAVWFNRRRDPCPVGHSAVKELTSFLPTGEAVATIMSPASPA